MYPSDGLGCDYGNNWNSVHYGKKKVTDVRVQVGMALSGDPQIRSSLDSYLMASAYTRSCSNDNYLDANCFGLTHPEEKRWCILWILISCGLIGVELLLYLIYFVIGKIKYRRAVNASNPEATDDLLNATVYACVFEGGPISARFLSLAPESSLHSFDVVFSFLWRNKKGIEGKLADHEREFKRLPVPGTGVQPLRVWHFLPHSGHVHPFGGEYAGWWAETGLSARGKNLHTVAELDGFVRSGWRRVVFMCS